MISFANNGKVFRILGCEKNIECDFLTLVLKCNFFKYAILDFSVSGTESQYNDMPTDKTASPLSKESLLPLCSATPDEGRTVMKSHDENVLARRFILVDSSNDLKTIQKEMRKVRFYAFICPLTRYTRERKRFLKKISKMKSFSKNCILIFTQQSEEQTDTFENELQAVSKMDKRFKKLLKKSNYLMCPKIGYENDSESYKEFRKQFTETLMETVEKHLMNKKNADITRIFHPKEEKYE